MPEPTWEKSSYSSGAGSGECLELAAGAADAESTALRESADPAIVLTAAPRRLAALLNGVRNGLFDRLT